MRPRCETRRHRRRKKNVPLLPVFLLLVTLLIVYLAPVAPPVISRSGTLNVSSSIITSSIPAHRNRLKYTWFVLPQVNPPTLLESGFRLLHSPLTERCTAGLGHALTVLNAELSTALLLHATYSHRVTNFVFNSTDAERIFNWGQGFLARTEVERRYCLLESNSSECPVCHELSDPGKILFHRIVVVPSNISYGCVSCRANLQRVKHFLAQHQENHTLFQMHPDRCTELPKSPDFTLSRPVYYRQYWRMAPVPPLSETHLNIAIHARRGDFFKHSRRRMTSLREFARVVNTAVRVVYETGDMFAQMPIKLILFSEGRHVKRAQAHDISAMDKQFVDTDRQPKHAGDLYELLTGERATLDAVRTAIRSKRFPSGLAVEFHIATSTEETIRSMAAADIFVGSASDLSQYAIRVVSRAGLQLLPDYLGFVSGCCAVRFSKGGFIKERDVRKMREYWSSFVVANRASAARAMGMALIS